MIVPAFDPVLHIGEELCDRQLEDGGWSSLAGTTADTESTAWATLALDAAGVTVGSSDGRIGGRCLAAARAGRRWLVRSQRDDGGWSWTDAVQASGWSTAPALLALAGDDGSDAAVRHGIGWLLETRGRSFPLWVRVVNWLLRRPPAIELDPSLRGWPWVPDTFGWVEPTAWALLALRANTRLAPSAALRARIEDGEAMLLDRSCVGGGWNYGNRTVLGEDLPPYPDTTAIALLGLGHREKTEAVRAGYEILPALLVDPVSRLSLALGALALRSADLDARGTLTRLRSRWLESPVPATTRVAALSLLALTDSPLYPPRESDG